eukprot:TRINITY_DN25822_c0_g1_i1.p1 TRINITY_DN25822_c0_g1~~TRINITY_DN25822_c0_g1_i1.p1  ORF type:complete len:803 (+),score=102.86 TRINITY_DN25822_c0_g1_i1:66-2411(+)
MVRFALLRKKTSQFFSSARSSVHAPVETYADESPPPRTVKSALFTVVCTDEAPCIPLPSPRQKLRTESERALPMKVVRKVRAWRKRASETVENQDPLPNSSEGDEGSRNDDLVSVLLQLSLVVNFSDVSEFRRSLSTLSKWDCMMMCRLCQTVISACPWHAAGLGTDKNPEEVVSMFLGASQPKKAYLELPTMCGTSSTGSHGVYGNSARKRHSVESVDSIHSWQDNASKMSFSNRVEGILRSRRGSRSHSRHNSSGVVVGSKSAFDDLRHPAGDASVAAKLAFSKKRTLSNLSGKSKFNRSCSNLSSICARKDKRNASSNSSLSAVIRSMLWRSAETTTRIGDVEYGGDGCPHASDEAPCSPGIYSRYAARYADEEPRQSSQRPHSPCTSPRGKSGSVSRFSEPFDGFCFFKYLVNVQNSHAPEAVPSFRRSMTSDTVNTSTLLDAVLHDVNADLLDNAGAESDALLVKFREENRKLRQANAELARSIASKTGVDTEATADLARSIASKTCGVTGTRSFMTMGIPTMELDEILCDTCKSDEEFPNPPGGSEAGDSDDAVDGKMEKSSCESQRMSKWLQRKEKKRAAKQNSGKLSYGALLRAEHEQTLGTDLVSDDDCKTEIAAGGVDILPIITVSITNYACQADHSSEADERDSDAEIASVSSATRKVAPEGDAADPTHRSSSASTAPPSRSCTLSTVGRCAPLQSSIGLTWKDVPCVGEGVHEQVVKDFSEDRTESQALERWMARKEEKRKVRERGKMSYGAYLRSEHEQNMDVGRFTD